LPVVDGTTSQLRDLIDTYDVVGEDVVPPISSDNAPENLLLAVAEKKFESVKATLSLLSGSISHLINEGKKVMNLCQQQ